MSFLQKFIFNNFLKGSYNLLAAAFLSILFNFNALAERGEVIPSQTNFRFLGGSNFHSFRGNISKFKGFIFSHSKDVKNTSYIQIEFDPISFSTHNTARDENMHKTISKSLIQFRSTNILISHDGAFADITGRLIINNIAKRIVFTAYLSKPSPKQVKATGSFWIKLSDYNLKPPAPAFIRLNDKVKVEFEAVSTWPH